MDQQNQLEVITRQGWRREYPLHKGIIYIGSAETNDIVLGERFGGGVAPLHVQLINATADNAGYKLINLSETPIAVGAESETELAPRSVLALTAGQQFTLGDFTLIFHGNNQTAGAATQTSRAIGLTLNMPQTQLAPHQSLEGIVTVSNLGRQVGARFNLTLEGMEAGCYDIAPGPLLSSGAEKDVLFRLHHLGSKPLAGQWRIVIRATAPETYPGEQAAVSQVIQVLPYRRHRLQVMPARGITLPHKQEPAAQAAAPRQKTGWEMTAPQNSPAAVTLKADGARPAAPTAQPQPAPPAPPLAETTIAPRPAPPQTAETPPAASEQTTLPTDTAALPRQPQTETDDSWADAVEEQTISRTTAPAQKIKAAAPSPESSPANAATEKEEDWWATP